MAGGGKAEPEFSNTAIIRPNERSGPSSCASIMSESQCESEQLLIRSTMQVQDLSRNIMQNNTSTPESDNYLSGVNVTSSKTHAVL